MPTPAAPAPSTRSRLHRAGEVAWVFLGLGLTSFGGPVAHIGYFRRALVEQRRWLDEAHFGQLLALCQFLPGPASSQLGFAIGLLRAGWPGALAAFAGFTLPSALAMGALALAGGALDGRWGHGVVHGLKLVAVAVVAHGVIGMTRTLAPDATRRGMALVTAIVMLASAQPWLQGVLVAAGALAGPWLCRGVQPRGGEAFAPGYGPRTGAMLLALATLGLVLTWAPGLPPLAQGAAAFYRAGALVFGGGHVVLPLLQASVVAPGWLDADRFLAGYGAAQAVPGPMFSLSAFLGASLPGGMGGVPGALAAVLAIFTPGLLLVAGALPFWHGLAQRAGAARALAGVNAVVLGLLAAAWVNPVALSALQAPRDGLIAAIGLAMLLARWPALAAVGWCVAAALGVAALG